MSTMASSSPDGARPVDVTERSGVLFPERLVRYAAGWITPDSAVADVVDQYWHVTWALEPGERLDQPIIDLPAVTATVEDGDVPAPLVVTGVHRRAWRRTVHGSGTVFAVRLRPAGLTVLSDLTPRRIADATVVLDARLDPRLHALMREVAAGATPAERAAIANRAIARILADRGPAPSGLLANRVLDEVRWRIHRRTGQPLAERFGCSERTLQRACTEALGHGPKWLSRRIRLQEVALALVSRPSDELGVIAADLGYTDQSHLTRDFRATTGLTPEAYRRAVRNLLG